MRRRAAAPSAGFAATGPYVFKRLAFVGVKRAARRDFQALRRRSRILREEIGAVERESVRAAWRRAQAAENRVASH